MWGIPDDYAGMTNSMLHRCRSFVQLTGTEVTILTYEFRPDYDVVRTTLRERGAMIEGMVLRNLWEDLRLLDDQQLLRASRFVAGAEETFRPLGEAGDHEHALRNVLRADDGTMVQTDHFRPDGTLLVSDRFDVDGPKKRAVTLCDRSGRPLGTWHSPWELYWFWLDSLPRDPIAWMISDSKTSANHIVGYRRDEVVTMHVVHGSHLTPGTGRPMGELVKSRQNVFQRLDQWDAVVFLTEQQRAEVDQLLGPGANRHVCPHGRDVPDAAPTGKRPAHRGVMLTSLTKRKQIDHAIKAMSRVGRVGLRMPELAVYGRGGQKKALEQLVKRQSGHPRVALKGYATNAADEFENASFSLLTSNNEAFGLVLVESMGHGCIPISYDMPYGPAEIITDGVDGFLVPADDIDALAKTIRRVVRTRPSKLHEMRLAAHRRAQDFNDEHVTSHWAQIMHEALTTKRQAS